jgi:hypothetical protein
LGVSCLAVSSRAWPSLADPLLPAGFSNWRRQS